MHDLPVVLSIVCLKNSIKQHVFMFYSALLTAVVPPKLYWPLKYIFSVQKIVRTSSEYQVLVVVSI